MAEERDEAQGERIAKVLARAGIGSRREVERMIAAGRVAVGGETLLSPARNVASLEGITVDGHPVAPAEGPRLWRYHKPPGLVSTHRDPEGRTTLFETLPRHLPRVISIGRLDLDSEGLLLLTNDGALARWMELPATGWKRRYRVRVHGRPDEKRLRALAEGSLVEGVAYGPIEAHVERISGSNAWLSVALAEGRNREVRRVLASLGLVVTRLIRTAYGPFTLGNLPKGAVAEIPKRALVGALSGYFADAPSSVATAGKGIPDPAKWARAKRRPTRARSRRRRPST